MTIRVKPIKSTKRVIVGMTKEVHAHRQGIENGLHVVGDIVGDRVGKGGQVLHDGKGKV